MWKKKVGKKKHIMPNNFNPMWKDDDKEYLSSSIKGKAKILIAQLRTRSHHLKCEIGR